MTNKTLYENEVENLVEDSMNDIENVMNNQNITIQSGDLDILNSTNFVLTCQVGEVNLSFRDLSNLKIGDSIDFIKWPGKVKLFLNNLIFAEGYLVEIDNMLGVKITNRYNHAFIAE
jgi:flagellar motor switch/type III secretory pathway protein FliN